jgi:DNA-binding NarL/FixJ family response regulator
MAGELALWLFLIGQLEGIPVSAAEPFALVGAGDWEGAATFWEQRGIPYDRAVALSLGTSESKIEAIRILDDLGATPLASRLRAELAEAGVTGIPRGPSRATRANRFGLTPRQMDVLSHLAAGRTNSEIADLLFLSSRTVDHHVSAILGKLAATTRSEAVATAAESGLVGA